MRGPAGAHPLRFVAEQAPARSLARRRRSRVSPVPRLPALLEMLAQEGRDIELVILVAEFVRLGSI
jgi:hypothetical protein